MKIDLSVNKVTTVSKILALIIFVTFPLAGFLLGMKYQKDITAACPFDVLDSSKYICNTIKDVSNGIVDAEWNEYAIQQLGMKFGLPSSLSSRSVNSGLQKGGDSGTAVCFGLSEDLSFNLVEKAHAGASGCWSPLIPFGIGADSVDYTEGREASFADVAGYKIVVSKNDEKTYFVRPTAISDEYAYELTASDVKEFKNSNGVKMLVIKGGSKYSESRGSRMPTLGSLDENYIGAIINNKDKNYPGITIWMKLQGELNEEIFMKILDTVEL